MGSTFLSSAVTQVRFSTGTDLKITPPNQGSCLRGYPGSIAIAGKIGSMLGRPVRLLVIKVTIGLAVSASGAVTTGILTETRTLKDLTKPVKKRQNVKSARSTLMTVHKRKGAALRVQERSIKKTQGRIGSNRVLNVR